MNGPRRRERPVYDPTKQGEPTSDPDVVEPKHDDDDDDDGDD